MAKNFDSLKNIRKHMLIHPHTSGSSEHVKEFMSASGLTGEIFIQNISAATSGDLTASLWVLGNNNDTPIEFIDKTRIDKLLSGFTIQSGTSIDPSIKVEYWLEDADGDIHGEKIEIPNSSSIKKIFIGLSGTTIDPVTGEIIHEGDMQPEVLAFIYMNYEGEFTITEIDLEKFILEEEFKEGLQVSGHNVSVMIDPISDDYLSVSMSGVCLTGVKEDIEEEASARTIADIILQLQIDEEVSARTAEDVEIWNAISAYTLELYHLSASTEEIEEVVSSALNYLNKHKIEKPINEGTDGQRLTIDASGNTYWADSTAADLDLEISARTLGDIALQEELTELSAITKSIEKVSSYALNDLNLRINELNETISGIENNKIDKPNDVDYGNILASDGSGSTYWTKLTGGTNIKVENNVVSTIFDITFAKMTQAEYDALPVKDPNTLYIIVE